MVCDSPAVEVLGHAAASDLFQQDIVITGGMKFANIDDLEKINLSRKMCSKLQHAMRWFTPG